MDTFIKHVNDTSPLSEKTWIEFKNILEKKTYPSGYKLVESGKKTNYMFFSLSGITRAYSLSETGKELNNLIFPEKSYLGTISSLILNVLPKANLECLTECELVHFNYYDFIKLTDTYIDLNIFHRKNLETFYMNLEVRDFELANLTSTERYLALKNRIPTIDNLISQKHIALHLGITPIQLSRLKKNHLFL